MDTGDSVEVAEPTSRRASVTKYMVSGGVQHLLKAGGKTYQKRHVNGVWRQSTRTCL
jgi:hypothetical protein